MAVGFSIRVSHSDVHGKLRGRMSPCLSLLAGFLLVWLVWQVFTFFAARHGQIKGSSRNAESVSALPAK
jgi:hypothetical protein